MIIGVDNGACSGAAAAISANSGALVSYTTLPNHKVRNKTEIDLGSFRDWVSNLETKPTAIIIEEPLHHAPSSQSMRSMAICYGQIYGLCMGMGWPCEGVLVKEWQKDMLGKIPKGQSKKYASSKAAYLEPSQKWVDPRKPRATKAHDGIIDAYLIAQWRYAQIK